LPQTWNFESVFQHVSRQLLINGLDLTLDGNIVVVAFLFLIGSNVRMDWTI